MLNNQKYFYTLQFLIDVVKSVLRRQIYFQSSFDKPVSIFFSYNEHLSSFKVIVFINTNPFF